MQTQYQHIPAVLLHMDAKLFMCIFVCVSRILMADNFDRYSVLTRECQTVNPVQDITTANLSHQECAIRTRLLRGVSVTQVVCPKLVRTSECRITDGVRECSTNGLGTVSYAYTHTLSDCRKLLSLSRRQ